RARLRQAGAVGVAVWLPPGPGGPVLVVRGRGRPPPPPPQGGPCRGGGKRPPAGGGDGVGGWPAAPPGLRGGPSPGPPRGGWGGRPRPGRRQDVSTSERRSAVAYRPRHRCTPNRQLRPNGPPLADPSSSLPLLLFVLRSGARIAPPFGGSTPQQSGTRSAGRT